MTDMLSGKEYDDFRTRLAPPRWWSASEDGTRLVLDKHFEGADFVLRLSFTLDDTCLQWDVFARKTAGPDRQIRLTYLLPLPYMNAWAPMNESTTRLRWEEPFQVRHGLAYGRSVQQEHRTALIPMVSLFDRNRSVTYAVPPDVPNVCIRFMNSADEDSLFLLNSIRQYPIEPAPALPGRQRFPLAARRQGDALQPARQPEQGQVARRPRLVRHPLQRVLPTRPEGPQPRRRLLHHRAVGPGPRRIARRASGWQAGPPAA